MALIQGWLLPLYILFVEKPLGHMPHSLSQHLEVPHGAALIEEVVVFRDLTSFMKRISSSFCLEGKALHGLQGHLR